MPSHHPNTGPPKESTGPRARPEVQTSDPTRLLILGKRGSAIAFGLIISAALSWGCNGSQSTPTEPPGPDVEPSNAVWGALGCSQTRDAVEGYRRIGGEQSWAPNLIENYGGGTLDVWSNTGHPLWGDFQAAISTHGDETQAVWFQVCVLARTDPMPTPSDLMQAEIIVEEIRARLPGVHHLCVTDQQLTSTPRSVIWSGQPASKSPPVSRTTSS